MLVVLPAAKARKRASESMISGDKLGVEVVAELTKDALENDAALDDDAPLKKLVTGLFFRKSIIDFTLL
jgi:hypothetical protein